MPDRSAGWNSILLIGANRIRLEFHRHGEALGSLAVGLVFIGASNDHCFRAFDSRSGKELWVSPRLGMSAHTVTVTYLGRYGQRWLPPLGGRPKSQIADHKSQMVLR
jgi:hypothetical protein